MMNITYGISEKIGCRSLMEDVHAIYQDADRKFFAAEIYDGHGGREAAEITSRMLTPYFMHAWAMEFEKPLLKDRRGECELMREAYLSVDAHLIERGIKSGTTAANLYFIGDRFLAANAGDTRVIIGTRKGFSFLTKDHKPDLPEERVRIESLGGRVLSYGAPRVEGVLAMSRALGDTGLKPYVSSEPRIVEGYPGKENDYAVLACDGVWDVLAPDDVIKTVRTVTDPWRASEEISKKALNCGSTDNITVIVLDLREYVKGLKRKHMETTGVVDYGV
jgi:serine/threonine protein phosphatase PrpC